ncbi:hypothetical protein [Zooshikella ganghwensis]|uniref:hypothetical protein n=1 Tax=Zooshikella ganghwensis TaxID=202772 RepID=UPI000483EA11|nr:hypothetical protein [Zooshikella ganghwensis]
MKLNSLLKINQQNIPLVRHDIRLAMNTPGRATFVVRPNTPVTPKSVVKMAIGYGDNLQQIFLGYIEKITTVDQHQQQIFCRELTGILHYPLPMNLRHVHLNDVLNHMAKHTGLTFITPEQPYTNTKIPYFYSLNNGLFAMASLKEAFAIEDYCWQQQGDGQVFVGSWQHSYWANKPVTIPDQFLINHQSHNSAQIAAIPQVRPGVKLVDGRRIQKTQLQNNQMVVTW